MKFAAVVVFMLSTLALAGPVKRYIVTEYEIVTVTVIETVTATKSRPGITMTTPLGTSPSLTNGAPVNSDTTTSAFLALSTSSVQGSSQTELSDYASKVLEQHNLHRRNHSVTDLTWDYELVNLAKIIADTCVYGHSSAAGDGKYGQNIGAGLEESGIPKMITNLMYNNEMVYYPGYDTEPSLSNFETWGHFTQIVWKNTTRVGCYTTSCKTLANVGSNVKPYFTVCNYRPQGNFVGSFNENVFRPLGHPSIVL